MVFSPSESHCATCGDDGSVRVWSLASMELVIQFQVLNQVLGAPGAGGACCEYVEPLSWGPDYCPLEGSGSCILPPASVSVALGVGPCPAPRGVLIFPHWGSPELPLPGLEPDFLWTPRAATRGSRL